MAKSSTRSVISASNPTLIAVSAPSEWSKRQPTEKRPSTYPRRRARRGSGRMAWRAAKRSSTAALSRVKTDETLTRSGSSTTSIASGPLTRSGSMNVQTKRLVDQPAMASISKNGTRTSRPSGAKVSAGATRNAPYASKRSGAQKSCRTPTFSRTTSEKARLHASAVAISQLTTKPSLPRVRTRITPAAV